jgi:hypothetical protein
MYCTSILQYKHASSNKTKLTDQQFQNSFEDEPQTLDIQIISNQDPKIDQIFRETRFKLLKKYTQQYATQVHPYRWCIYEWFYSLGDEFFLRHAEFFEYLLTKGLVSSENVTFKDFIYKMNTQANHNYDS